jgi:hypothetical protein
LWWLWVSSVTLHFINQWHRTIDLRHHVLSGELALLQIAIRDSKVIDFGLTSWSSFCRNDQLSVHLSGVFGHLFKLWQPKPSVEKGHAL